MSKKIQAKAPKGGTIGVNGEFYEGGKFLPNTQRPRQDCSRKRKQWSGKVELEPYVWVKYEGALAENECIISLYKLFETSYGAFGKAIWSADRKSIVDWEWIGDNGYPYIQGVSI
jgi:hypothetical protein